MGDGKFTNIFKSGEIKTSPVPDCQDDYYEYGDAQLDHNYWQEKIARILKIISNDETNDFQIIFGGQVTDGGSGTINISKGVAVGKDVDGNIRLIEIPVLTGVSLPSGWNDDRQIWVIGKYESGLSTETRTHFLGGTYHYIIQDGYFGDSTTDNLFVDSLPSDVIIWGSFKMNGTTFASQSGRSTEYNIEQIYTHKTASELDHPDGSIEWKHFSDDAKERFSQKYTEFRGTYAKLYPVSGDSSYRKATLFLEDIECITTAQLSQDIDEQEQEYPVSRLDNSQEVETSTYSVLTTLSEASADKAEFTPDSNLLFSGNHNRAGIKIDTIGSGYTHLRVELHDVSNTNLGHLDIAIGSLTVGWNYFDISASITPGSVHHYHCYVIGFTSGTTTILKSDGTTFAFRELYIPDSGKYGSANIDDVVKLLDYTGSYIVSDRGPAEDIGYITTGYDFVAVDFSNTSDWDSWEYNDFIGVDLSNGRIKLPSALSLDSNVIYAEFNVSEGLDYIDAKNILLHNRTQSIEDSIFDIDTFIDESKNVNINDFKGLISSNDAGDTDHDINTTAGWCLDDTGTHILELPTEMTKQLDAPWSVGDDAGGLDTGTIASNTWYYRFLIRKDSDGSTDILLSVSQTSPVMPSGYTYKRRLRGAVLTNSSSNIEGFRQKGNYFWYNAYIKDVDDAASGTTRKTPTVQVPPNFIGIFHCLAGDTGTQYAWVNNTSFIDVTPSSSNADLYTSSASVRSVVVKEILVDSSSQIAYRTDGTLSFKLQINTQGFIDNAEI